MINCDGPMRAVFGKVLNVHLRNHADSILSFVSNDDFFLQEVAACGAVADREGCIHSAIITCHAIKQAVWESFTMNVYYFSVK